jgi:hypothetical protein
MDQYFLHRDEHVLQKQWMICFVRNSVLDHEPYVLRPYLDFSLSAVERGICGLEDNLSK